MCNFVNLGSMCTYVHVSVGVRGNRSSRAGLTGGYDPPDMGAGK